MVVFASAPIPTNGPLLSFCTLHSSGLNWPCSWTQSFGGCGSHREMTNGPSAPGSESEGGSVPPLLMHHSLMHEALHDRTRQLLSQLSTRPYKRCDRRVFFIILLGTRPMTAHGGIHPRCLDHFGSFWIMGKGCWLLEVDCLDKGAQGSPNGTPYSARRRLSWSHGQSTQSRDDVMIRAHISDVKAVPSMPDGQMQL